MKCLPVGDAVLGFALAVATLASNTTLTWDDIDLRENISSAARNVELCQASLRVGLLKLARACPNPMQTLDAGHTEQLDDLCSAKRLNVGIMNSVAADMFESVLAALFLCGRQSDCGKELSSRLMVGLLNSASLPAVSHSAPSVCTFSSNLCINKGFAFDETWENQLFTLFRESICFVFTKPDDSISLLCDNLHAGACHREIIEQTIPKALLSCALFNGLESIFDVTILKHESARNNVRMLEHLREILFHVGAYSLQLCLSEDLFNSFKNASPGDLHLLRAAAITDDAVAFVMVKNELHLSLSRESLYADLFTNCQGIAGGRFINRSSKLPGEQTKELVVSFKAIFGALVVCLGMDHAWLLVKSMFAELTALSPEDLRRLHSSSTLVSSYQ